ncbi:hypothetical protein CLOSYM_04176 [[Clostridium] symbiosum ATCC 14940]|uniref:Uncharacterized protein n=1 Tax=[Clostridium] symbiosum ATCC 14940 TaxID=411472 RepID=A0ABC9TSX7_CLOSY|nr:hypothetical protein CLOSYM_04176 [[Clostridium] symbiosum ATCC 14940]
MKGRGIHPLPFMLPEPGHCQSYHVKFNSFNIFHIFSEMVPKSSPTLVLYSDQKREG